jgi:hypothetical protein
MGVELKKDNGQSISVHEMKDGQIGEIVQDNVYGGRIVQRFDRKLISLGFYSGKAWEYIFESTATTMKIRLLEKGEKIFITRNTGT